MKLKEISPEFMITENEEFSISGTVVTELAKTILAKGVSFRMRTKGFSMSPFIKDDDVVTISPLFNRSLGIGEVAGFISSRTGKLVIHRVIERNRGLYAVKGDSASTADGFISKENILGYVAKIERNGKKVAFGLGLERIIIALFSKVSLVNPMLKVWRLCIPFSIRRFIKCRILL